MSNMLAINLTNFLFGISIVHWKLKILEATFRNSMLANPSTLYKGIKFQKRQGGLPWLIYFHIYPESQVSTNTKA